MKQLINGLVYDTETAQKLVKVEQGGNFSYTGYIFYKTAKGRLFKESVWFNCAFVLDRLSETTETEMLEILIKYNYNGIEKLFPNVEVA